jgi:hypothetical protein
MMIPELIKPATQSDLSTGFGPTVMGFVHADMPIIR